MKFINHNRKCGSLGGRATEGWPEGRGSGNDQVKGHEGHGGLKKLPPWLFSFKIPPLPVAEIGMIFDHVPDIATALRCRAGRDGSPSRPKTPPNSEGVSPAIVSTPARLAARPPFPHSHLLLRDLRGEKPLLSPPTSFFL